MTEQWQELKDTIIELRDNDGTGTQQEVCKFLVNLMGILEKQMQEPKTGHWIEYTKVIIPEPINKWKQAWKCSECDYGGQDDDEDGWLEWNYCPNCGAKMESEGKE